MALHPLTFDRGSVLDGLLRTTLVIVAVITLMIVATVIFGWNGTSPSIDLTTDPLGGLRIFGP
jgi:hypothetical protein